MRRMFHMLTAAVSTIPGFSIASKRGRASLYLGVYSRPHQWAIPAVLMCAALLCIDPFVGATVVLPIAVGFWSIIMSIISWITSLFSSSEAEDTGETVEKVTSNVGTNNTYGPDPAWTYDWSGHESTGLLKLVDDAGQLVKDAAYTVTNASDKIGTMEDHARSIRNSLGGGSDEPSNENNSPSGDDLSSWGAKILDTISGMVSTVGETAQTPTGAASLGALGLYLENLFSDDGESFWDKYKGPLVVGGIILGLVILN